ncbi:hypothetical protein HK101_007229 [Irineochytrium annulatum]|nr:hypothetical protein HK101_007229 [Irineochytrium annulatum]
MNFSQRLSQQDTASIMFPEQFDQGLIDDLPCWNETLLSAALPMRSTSNTSTTSSGADSYATFTTNVTSSASTVLNFQGATSRAAQDLMVAWPPTTRL